MNNKSINVIGSSFPTIEQKVIIVMGTIGSGKTNLSSNIALRMGMKRIGSDDIRKMLGINEHTLGTDDIVYDKMAKITSKELKDCGSVILDATYYLKRWRIIIASICKEYKIPLYAVYCDVSKKMRRQIVSIRDHCSGAMDKAVLQKLEREYENIGFDESSNFKGIISVYRSTNITISETKPARPTTNIIALIAEKTRANNMNWKVNRVLGPATEEIKKDINSAILVAKNTNAVSVYILGSLVTEEFSYFLHEGNQYNLSDYDYLIIYNNGNDIKNEKLLKSWKYCIESKKTGMLKRRVIGFQCYHEDMLPRMYFIYGAQFYITGQLIFGKEIRTSHNAQILSNYIWNRDEAMKAWLFRLRVIAIRLYKLLCDECDGVKREIVSSYYIIRAGLDLALCGCLENGIVPMSHHEAVNLLGIIEGRKSAIYKYSSMCLRVKMLNDNININERFPMKKWYALKSMLEISKNRWLHEDTLLHRVVCKLADNCRNIGLNNFKGKLVETSLAEEMGLNHYCIDDLISILSKRTHDDVIGVWPETISTLRISENN